MANYLTEFNTMAEYQAATLDYPNVSVIKDESNKVIYAPNMGFDVTYSPISAYSSTTYGSVFSFADLKWYMRNNLNQYEEYGIYDTGSTLSGFTYYNNKLVAIGEIEYQRKGNEWVEVGTYVNSSVSYEISREAQLQGTELSTTFKIPYADVESEGWADFYIIGTNNEELYINLDTGGTAYYSLDGDVEGTVTNDGEYFYLSLPDGSPQSIVINSIDYMSPNPIHIIVGSTEATVEYEAKEVPIAKVFNSIQEMQSTTYPVIGINQYGVVGTDVYQYNASTGWENVGTHYKVLEINADGEAYVAPCNSSTELAIGETKPSWYNYSTLVSTIIGNCVTNIGIEAFIDCSNLTSVTIPDSVTSIDGGVFNNTPWWNSYSADTSNQYGNIIYINDVAYKATSTSITTAAFKSGTVGIGGSAFNICQNLTTINIPDSVTSIGIWAFNGCSGLTTVTIGSGVTSINAGAFMDCSRLTSITIPDSVTSIAGNTFQNCTGLTTVTIGTGVTSIGSFAFDGCKRLTSATCLATTPPSLGNGVFPNTNANLKIYVPAASVNAYKSASGWSTYASRIQAIP